MSGYLRREPPTTTEAAENLAIALTQINQAVAEINVLKNKIRSHEYDAVQNARILGNTEFLHDGQFYLVTRNDRGQPVVDRTASCLATVARLPGYKERYEAIVEQVRQTEEGDDLAATMLAELHEEKARVEKEHARVCRELNAYRLRYPRPTDLMSTEDIQAEIQCLTTPPPESSSPT